MKRSTLNKSTRWGTVRRAKRSCMASARTLAARPSIFKTQCSDFLSHSGRAA
jgi:hypothetical protein